MHHHAERRDEHDPGSAFVSFGENSLRDEEGGCPRDDEAETVEQQLRVVADTAACARDELARLHSKPEDSEGTPLRQGHASHAGDAGLECDDSFHAVAEQKDQHDHSKARAFLGECEVAARDDRECQRPSGCAQDPRRARRLDPETGCQGRGGGESHESRDFERAGCPGRNADHTNASMTAP